jgi:enoyl-CoA hydratase/carnithine racemase
MSFETIILKKDGGIATIVLNRPDRLNANNNKMLEELSVALDDVGGDEKIRVLVTTGAGRAFCAGGDVKGGEGEGAERDLRKLSPTALKRFMREIGVETTLKLRRLPIPTIAMVNGYAIGFGLDWALACDLRIGSENAKFRWGYTSIAVTSNFGGTWLLAQVVGVPKAAEIMFTEELVDAQEALRIGLLNRVVTSAQLEKETMALANKISEGPPTAIKWDKYLLYSGLQQDMESAMELATLSKAPTILSKDHEEAVDAFVEKRKPSFTGK